MGTAYEVANLSFPGVLHSEYGRVKSSYHCSEIFSLNENFPRNCVNFETLNRKTWKLGPDGHVKIPKIKFLEPEQFRELVDSQSVDS